MAIRIEYNIDEQIMKLVNNIYRYQKAHDMSCVRVFNRLVVNDGRNTLKCFDKEYVTFEEIIKNITERYRYNNDHDLLEYAIELEELIEKKKQNQDDY